MFEYHEFQFGIHASKILPLGDDYSSETDNDLMEANNQVRFKSKKCSEVKRCLSAPALTVAL